MIKIGKIADIALNASGVVADLINGRPELPFATTGHEQAGALFGEPLRRSQTDAAGRARDHGDLSLEPSGHAIVSDGRARPIAGWVCIRRPRVIGQLKWRQTPTPPMRLTHPRRLGA